MNNCIENFAGGNRLSMARTSETTKNISFAVFASVYYLDDYNRANNIGKDEEY